MATYMLIVFFQFPKSFHIWIKEMCVIFFPLEKTEMSLLLEIFGKDAHCYVSIHPRKHPGRSSHSARNFTVLLLNNSKGTNGFCKS